MKLTCRWEIKKRLSPKRRILFILFFCLLLIVKENQHHLKSNLTIQKEIEENESDLLAFLECVNTVRDNHIVLVNMCTCEHEYMYTRVHVNISTCVHV